MKKFEVGKRYMVNPYSINENGEKDHNKPVTMVVVKRTESTIWCDVDRNAWGIQRESHRLLKAGKQYGIEAINCGYECSVWADEEA